MLAGVQTSLDKKKNNEDFQFPTIFFKIRNKQGNEWFLAMPTSPYTTAYWTLENWPEHTVPWPVNLC